MLVEYFSLNPTNLNKTSFNTDGETRQNADTLYLSSIKVFIYSLATIYKHLRSIIHFVPMLITFSVSSEAHGNRKLLLIIADFHCTIFLDAAPTA